MAHEETHRRGWQCLVHPEERFDTLEGYKDHLRAAHNADSMYLTSPELLQASRITLEDARKCPFCGDSPRALEQHMARHMVKIALFTLPRFDDNESGESDAAVASLHDRSSGVGSSTLDFGSDENDSIDRPPGAMGSDENMGVGV
jgi:hypothetical protein